ncbi:helix-turn-helix domain-containing protein [Streptomyces cupreus]|uniref:helix-turn-helix domain-containing protein n=1 Tax=Streptomyces cupreus TaxID=2759956 RepID=UPI0021B1A699|nr:hypothetical protein [Streptomyces cupreus]
MNPDNPPTAPAENRPVAPEALREQYESGATVDELVTASGLSYGTVLNRLHDAGIEMRTSWQTRRMRQDPQARQRLAAHLRTLYEEHGATLAELAAAAGETRRGARRLLIEAGGTVRTTQLTLRMRSAARAAERHKLALSLRARYEAGATVPELSKDCNYSVATVYRLQPSSEPTVGRMGDIDPALAGQPLTTRVGAFDVVLEFPKFEGRFPAQGYVSWSGTHVSAPTALSPAYFTAHVTFPLDPSLDEPAVQAEVKAAIAVLRFAAARLSDALRVEQPSVGMVGDIPKMLSLTAQDVTRGLALSVPEPLTPGYPVVRGLPTLTIDSATTALNDGASPARALLSQARYLTQSTNSPQPGMATLLAAVAAETYAKETLRSARAPGSCPSLRSLQDTHGSAVALYGPIAHTVIGRSLENDDPDLWSNLVSLFTARNRMAHKLKTPAHPDAARLVVTAMRSMDWLTACAS